MLSRLHKISAIFVVALLVITACDQPANVQQDQQKVQDEQLAEQGDPIDGQFIVVFDNSAAQGKATVQKRSRQIDAIMGKYSISEDAVMSRYKNALGGFTAKLSDKQLSKLRQNDNIKYIEQDRVVTLAPPGSCSPWPGCRDDDDDGGGTSQTTPYGITRVGGATASSGTAWVIDTGIDLDHPDLNVDTQQSAVFVSSGPGSGSADDGNGHGTHVAGTIGAIDNDRDVVGVAAGATMVAVKVLDDRGSGSFSGVIDGIDYVAANASAGDVANMSLGGGTSDAVDDAVRNAADQGIYFAVAAGNDSDDANNYSPARVEYTNVWTISAIDSNDDFASFSNYGNPPIEHAAPGVDILSLWLDGGTNTISGTSMASPHAAGVLLVTGGNPSSDGTANGDPDGTADPIIHQ